MENDSENFTSSQSERASAETNSLSERNVEEGSIISKLPSSRDGRLKAASGAKQTRPQEPANPRRAIADRDRQPSVSSVVRQPSSFMNVAKHFIPESRFGQLARGQPQKNEYSSFSEHEPYPHGEDYYQLLHVYKRASDELDFHRAQAKEVKREIAAKNDERGQLLGQIADLKQSIASMGKLQTQVSDDYLRQCMQRLANDIRDWVLNTFRKAKLRQLVFLPFRQQRAHKPKAVAFKTITPGTQHIIERALPVVSIAWPQPKLHVCQAIVADQLGSVFNCESLVLQDAKAQAVFETGKIIEGRFPNLPSTSLPELTYCPAATTDNKSQVNEWRSLTNSMLYSMAEKDLENVTSQVREDLANRIRQTFSEILDSEMSDFAFKQLKSIIFAAIKISRTLRMQRARFRVKLPTQGEFDPVYMQNDLGEDEPDLLGSHISIGTFPCLLKAGDEHGENPHLQNVIMKARVKCFDVSTKV